MAKSRNRSIEVATPTDLQLQQVVHGEKTADADLLHEPDCPVRFQFLGSTVLNRDNQLGLVARQLTGAELNKMESDQVTAAQVDYIYALREQIAFLQTEAIR